MQKLKCTQCVSYATNHRIKLLEHNDYFHKPVNSRERVVEIYDPDTTTTDSNEKKMVLCGYCDEKFEPYLLNVHHYNFHFKYPIPSYLLELPYICAQCPMAFRDSGALHRHNNLSHPKYKCHECRHFVTNSEDRFKKHNEKYHPQRENSIFQVKIVKNGRRLFQCEYCDCTFGVKSERNDHHYNYHFKHPAPNSYTKPEHICKICKIASKTRLTLKNHGNICKTIKIEYKCTECRNFFASDSVELKAHIEKYHKIRPSLISNTRTAADQDVTLERNLPTQRKNTKAILRNKKRKMFISKVKKSGIRCPDCHRIFSGKKCITSHRCIGKQKITSVDSTSCVFCNRKFSTLRGLGIHLWAIHHIGKHFQCDICKHTVRSKARLRRHLKFLHDPAYIDVSKSIANIEKVDSVQVENILAIKKADGLENCHEIALTMLEKLNSDEEKIFDVIIDDISSELNDGNEFRALWQSKMNCEIYLWINIDIFNLIKKMTREKDRQILFPHSIYYVGVTKNSDRTFQHIEGAMKNEGNTIMLLKNKWIRSIIKEKKNFLVVTIRENMYEDDAHIREGMIIRSLSIHNLLNSMTGRHRPAALKLKDQQTLVSSMLCHGYERLMSGDPKYVKEYGYSNW